MIFSLRIAEKDHMNPDYIKELLEVLSECGNCFDEVWVAAPYYFLTADECKKNAEMMKQAAETFKKCGITPSLQISRTIGHAPGLLQKDTYDNRSMNRIVFIDGKVSPGRLCWNNDFLRKYIFESTKIYASMQPEIVWVDDDLRLCTTSGATALCFCDKCIQLFNERHGYAYDREKLRIDFLENNNNIREEYIEFQIQSLAELARLISEAVHQVAPEAYMALQSCSCMSLANKAHTACLNEMQEVSGKAPAVRVGSGVYDDHNPIQILEKALRINQMNSRMPEYIVMRSCEIENLPFIAYGKSIEGTCIEAALYMAYGCNMASVTLMNQNEPLSYHKKMFEKICTYRPYFEKVIKHNEGTINGGIAVYQSDKSHLAYVGKDCDVSWCNDVIYEATQLLRWGIPIHTEKAGNIYYLSTKASQYLLREDVEFLLTQPVVTDAVSVQKLIKMGYGAAVGLNIMKNDGRLDNAVENMAEHIVNRGINLREWQDSYYYSKEEKYVLEGKEMEAISNYCKNGEVIGCAIAVITTAYGAKWLVRSNNLGNGAVSFARRNQLLNAMNYIAEKPLPAYVNSPDQILVVPRVNEAGQTVSVTLLNVSISDGEDMEVVIENPVNTEYCTIVDPYAEDKKVALVKKNGKYMVTIDKLNPWRVKTILL